MKKISMIMLALVVALGGLGVGYAMWSDTVTISGSVTTGSVDIDIESVSETWVYKIIDGGGIVFMTAPIGNLVNIGDSDGTHLLVASATTTGNSDDEEAEVVNMTFSNIFPTPYTGPIVADVVLHYVGSIPVHIWYEEVVDPSLEPYIVKEWLVSEDGGTSWRTVANFMDIQLHYCYLLKLNVWLNPALLQADGMLAQGVTGNFNMTINAHQWNEDWQ